MTYDTCKKVTNLSLTVAAKLDSFGPDPPAKPFPRAEPNTLPLPRASNPEVAPPKPNPDGLFSDFPRPVVVIVEVIVDDFPLKAPNPDVLTLLLKTLGFDAPMVPNGEEL
jgi:hypothetical protein